MSPARLIEIRVCDIARLPEVIPIQRKKLASERKYGSRGGLQRQGERDQFGHSRVLATTSSQ
jgi:bisphosphoglycerate-dependent phosphoglycerate mutase